MTGIYTVADLIERLQAFPEQSKIAVVNVTPGRNDQRLAVFGVSPLPNESNTAMISVLELPSA
jgi:hypothetical protein